MRGGGAERRSKGKVSKAEGEKCPTPNGASVRTGEVNDNSLSPGPQLAWQTQRGLDSIPVTQSSGHPGRGFDLWAGAGSPELEGAAGAAPPPRGHRGMCVCVRARMVGRFVSISMAGVRGGGGGAHRHVAPKGQRC